MSLIDSTYFVNEINLPEGTYNTIQAHIDRYEREILIQLLGYDLYKLIAAYDAGASEQRIIDIVEGKEYREGDYMVKWNGLINDELVSILSYYVFIKYLENNTASFVNTAVVVPGAENGEVLSPAGLIQRASGLLSELAGYPGQSIYTGSLYNFMVAHQSDYPEWLFDEYKTVNMFGI